MGCSIHLHVEEKWHFTDGSTKWFRLCKWESFNRNYDVFALMAGVRNDYELNPIDEPRGLPDDVNEDIKEEFNEYGTDAHSASYLTRKELVRVRNKYFKKFGSKHEDLETLIALMDQRKRDTRVVFWFDN